MFIIYKFTFKNIEIKDINIILILLGESKKLYWKNVERYNNKIYCINCIVINYYSFIWGNYELLKNIILYLIYKLITILIKVGNYGSMQYKL